MRNRQFSVRTESASAMLPASMIQEHLMVASDVTTDKNLDHTNNKDIEKDDNYDNNENEKWVGYNQDVVPHDVMDIDDGEEAVIKHLAMESLFYSAVTDMHSGNKTDAVVASTTTVAGTLAEAHGARDGSSENSSSRNTGFLLTNLLNYKEVVD